MGDRDLIKETIAVFLGDRFGFREYSG